MALDPSEFKSVTGYDEAGMPQYGTESTYKPWSFASNLGGYREPGNASLRSADNPELSGYFQQKYGTAMDQAYRQQMENIRNSGGMELWNAGTGEAAGLDPRTWDQLLMPAFQASGAAADPRFGEYQNLWKDVQSSGQAVDAANAAAMDKAFKQKVLMGLALTGGVMGAGAMGFLGDGGLSSLAGGGGGLGLEGGAIPWNQAFAGELGSGGLMNLSSGAAGALEAPTILTGGLSNATGGAGMGSAFGLSGAELPTIITGGLSSASGGSGLGAPFGLEGSLVTPAAGVGSAGGGQQAGGQGLKMPGQPSAGAAPTGGGGSLSQGATQAITTPPGNAPLAAGGSAALPAGQGGGGDFVSGILDQFKKNALSLGLMGLSLAGVGSQQGKTPEAVGKLEQNANLSSDLARQYFAAAQAGQLTGPQQASLDKYKQDAKNQIRQYFSSIGQFDSTSRIQAEAQIDQTAVAMQQQLVQQTLQNGLSLMNASNTPLGQVAQYQMGQDQALVNAMGSFAQGIGSLFGQQAGQGQTNRGTQTTQNPMYPPNAGPQVPVAPSTTNQPIIQDNNWNV